ncbi:BQ5605_C002g01430 [Microbotryum silenes-dioicae]|uniref:Small nuclear ribonucleoprotein Sm D2 n=1 Tax=Microbotryum silenes-dioicae TaxID=796604 RepID=A0A2X0M369_9BASI|nr:BQ5605_C002g01430 [Microbotryum silenes-dioicae]
MSENQHTAKSELDETQIKALEEHEISQGPLSVLQTSVRSGTQILVALRNNRKLLGKVKAFDRHANMVLENVKEMWTEAPKGKGKKPINKDRFVSKMCTPPRGFCRTGVEEYVKSAFDVRAGPDEPFEAKTNPEARIGTSVVPWLQSFFRDTIL